MDVFHQEEEEEEETSGDVKCKVIDEQLMWLRETLSLAEHDPNIKHIFVQGHTPVMTTSSSSLCSRVSGKLKLQDGTNSPFWKTLSEYDVDIYLTGETHDITISQDNDPIHNNNGGRLIQIVHGGLMGFPCA